MKIRIRNKLIISDPIPAVRAYCEKNLILDNPDYYKLERLGKWTGNTPSQLWLYEQSGNELWLPFGCLQDIWRIHPIASDYCFEISPLRPCQYKSNINLYPYQEDAVRAALKAKNGILVMPCGSGKTQCGIEIIARIGGRALWLTHTQDLLNQSKQRAENVLLSCDMGTITGGKVRLGSNITFATVQTLSKLDLSEYRDQWDVVIIDEAQHCAGTPTRVTQFYKTVSRLSARYKFGLTATPKRSDGLQTAMFALLGPKFFEVTREDVSRTTCPVRVQPISTGWVPDYDVVLMGDGTINYSKVIENMVQDEGRYKLVLRTIACIDDPIIVLANRVDYLKKLCESMRLLGKRVKCLSGQGQSKSAKAERKSALEELNSGKLDCVLATYQLAKEGLDVPNLRYIAFATPEKDETTVIQAVGRVGRKADGKQYGTVIDFVDDFSMYGNWFKKRVGYYKKIDAEVIP